MQSYGMPILTIWQGIGSQVVTMAIKKSDGTAYDLTGKTVSVSGSIDGVYMMSSVACTLSATPTDGTLTFTPSAGELATLGAMTCQFRVNNGGAISFPRPFVLSVEAVQYAAAV